MTINEIKESGLLELYVLGTLHGAELTQVEQALTQYPELKAELNTIERTLQTYAFANAVPPSPGLKARILEDARNTKPPSGSDTNKPKKGGPNNNMLFGLLGLLTIATVLFAYMWNSTNQKMQQLEQDFQAQAADCDSLRNESEKQYVLYEDITNPNNTIVDVAAQPKFADTEIYFYHNPVDKINYLQLKSLPPIDNNTQSYQLWSIKGTNPPTPLDVFQSDGDLVLKVQFVDATDAYAITIEPKGGGQTPTMDDLVGVFAI